VIPAIYSLVKGVAAARRGADHRAGSAGETGRNSWSSFDA